MTDNEIFHIAVSPPDFSDTTLLKRIAAIIEKDVYDTRLLITGDLPRIIAHYQNRQAAEAIARSIKELGLPVLVCPDAELRQVPQVFIAYELELGNTAVVFRDSRGLEKRLEADDVFLIVKGNAHTRTETDTTQSKMQFSIGRTVIMGGIPMWRKVEEKTTDITVQTEYFARFYGRESAEPVVEFRQHHMNYSFLGAEIAPSSPANFNTVITRVREIFPQALFDERLAGITATGVSLTRLRDNPDINCRLIYLFHSAIRNRINDV